MLLLRIDSISLNQLYLCENLFHVLFYLHLYLLPDAVGGGDGYGTGAAVLRLDLSVFGYSRHFCIAALVAQVCHISLRQKRLFVILPYNGRLDFGLTAFFQGYLLCGKADVFGVGVGAVPARYA